MEGNREIKFRGKRVDNGEWVYGDLFIDKDLDTYCIMGFNYYNSAEGLQREPFEHVVDPKTVGQYSEKKDDFGNEVFEGDKIRLYEFYCEEEPELNNYVDRVVEWCKDGKCLTIEYSCGDYDYTAIGWAWDYFNNAGVVAQVIGNIHDNPELLNV